MTFIQLSRRPTRRAAAWGLAILASGLLGTFYFTRQERAAAQAAARQAFDAHSLDIEARIEVRMAEHEQILRSGAAFFAADNSVTRNEFRDYATRQNIDQTLPGIQGLGFAKVFPRSGLERHVREIRAEGFPTYRIWPEGARELYTSIVFLEPFTGRNLRAFGYDMFTEPVRRSAMERARDRDQVALSGKVLLVQEDGPAPQAGTLMYAPVYLSHRPHATVAERRADLLGWVYSPYRMGDLISTVILGGDDLTVRQTIRLEIFDGETATPAALLYDSQPQAGPAPATGATPTREAVVEHAGQRWLLRFTAINPVGGLVDYRSAWLVFGGGVVTSLLLAGLVLSLANTGAAARLLAARMNADLRASELRWKFAIEGPGDGLWDWNVPASTVFFTGRWKAMLGFAEDEVGDGLDEWSKRVHPDDLAAVMAAVQAHLAGTTPSYVNEHRVLCKDGAWKWILDRGLVVERDTAGQPLRMIGTHSDITERRRAEEQARQALVDEVDARQVLLSVIEDQKQAEHELLAVKGHLQATLDAIPDLVFEVGLDDRVHDYHARRSDLLASPPEVFLGKTFSDILPPAAAKVCQIAVHEASQTGWSAGGTYSLPLPKGDTWFELSVAAMPGNRDPRFIMLSRDITARKQAEEELRASLQEKEALLKEVHHRVKNNLQVITSLLRLETSRTGDAATRHVLRDMQGRILSMALLHETLYRTGIFGRVDLANYLQQLAGQLFRAHDAASGRLALAFDLSPVQADIDQAIPCGLIVNELLANSLKHAFAEGQTGEVKLSLQQDAEGLVRMQVSDTGVGLPADFEARRAKSLGLQLVSDLARQLGGKLEVSPGPGAGFTVTFTATTPHRTGEMFRPKDGALK